jgi:hypothetical protein
MIEVTIIFWISDSMGRMETPKGGVDEADGSRN